MTRSHRKKKTSVPDLSNDKESTKDIATSIPLATSKIGSFKHKPVIVAPQAQVGLLVTSELEKAIEECRTKVAQIIKGCRAVNRRFRDVEFDLENDQIRCLKGLNYTGEGSPGPPPPVLRLTQIFDKPQFVIDGTEAIDIIQGRLGDCWLLSALSTMSTSKGLIEKLCVERDEQVGVYGFVFFRGSAWVHVIIDDQLFWSLPKYEELSGREQDLYRGDKEAYNKLARHGGKGLYFARSGTEEETWVPLIEKAYAKLHGDYESLQGGYPSEAIEDLTGGVSVMYRTKDILDKDRFWTEELLHATKDRLFGCFFDGLDTSRKTDEVIIDSPRVNGLIGGHAYSVLRVKECKGKRFLVIRNPWGASEWTGAWGDGSKEWVGEWLEVLKELDHVFGDDGEFVMEYSDFLETFEVIERTTIFDSSWIMSSHWLRIPPQKPNHPWTFGDLSFKFTLNKPSFTIISLSQLDTRYFQAISGNSKWNIDFVLYKRGEKEITGVSYYALVQVRSVTAEINLEAGEYIIFPRCDRYYYQPPPGYLEDRRADWSPRTLTRVLTEKAKARSVAVNLHDEDDDIHFPITIDTLIEQDLEKLELESAKKEVVDDDHDEAEDDEEEEEKEKEKEKEKEDEKEEKESEESEESEEEDASVKVEGNPEKGSRGEPAMSDYLGSPEFPFRYGRPPKREDFDDEDLVLGVRIYTQGGAVVSVTGQVVGEVNDEESKDENATDKAKEEERDEEEAKKGNEDKEEGKERKEDAKEERKKAKDKKKK